ncbi:MAG: putative short chain dehydrogenase [Sphingomonadales bacterium]|nr:putative short chain dehydrogenase [Sphingomonadales bacterium]
MTRTTAITGTASGIGRATAAYLEARGDRVIRIDIAGGDVTADLGTVDGRAFAVSETLRLSHGKLDAVVACAGIASLDGPRVLSINHFGAVAILTGLRQALETAEAPRAVVICSTAGLMPVDAETVARAVSLDEEGARAAAAAAPILAYASSKQAIARWMRQTAVSAEWAGRGILLNGVAPGGVHTPILAPNLTSEKGRRVLARFSPIVLPDFAQPDDIAAFIGFLASSENRVMVGQAPFLDCGTEALLRDADVVWSPMNPAA